jgi:hypothetical protein
MATSVCSGGRAPTVARRPAARSEYSRLGGVSNLHNAATIGESLSRSAAASRRSGLIGQKESATAVGGPGRASRRRGRAAGDPLLPGERDRRRLGSDGGPSQKGMAVVWGLGAATPTGSPANLRAGRVVHIARVHTLCRCRMRSPRSPCRPAGWCVLPGSGR